MLKHESKHGSRLHKAVSTKLLQLGVFLPHWLVASYKVISLAFSSKHFRTVRFLNFFCPFSNQLRNPAELLRLLSVNGRIEESASLAVEYLEAALGVGKDRLNLNTSLMPQNPSIWVPLNAIDLLLSELETHSQSDIVYKQVSKVMPVMTSPVKTFCFSQFSIFVSSFTGNSTRLFDRTLKRP